MSGFVANELSAFGCGVDRPDCDFDSGASPGRSRRTSRTGLHPLVADEDPVVVVACQFPWPMEDGQRVVEVAMHPDRSLDVVAPVPVGRDLEFSPLEGDAVVITDLPVVLLAEDLVDVAADPWDKGGTFLQRRLQELLVECRQIILRDVPVGRLDIDDPVECQLLGQPVLMGAEHPFGPSPGLRGVGGDHLDAQLLHGAAELGGVLLVDLAAGLGGAPVVAAPVGVQGAEQSFGPNNFADPLEAAPGTFLVDEEHRVMLAGGVVHGDDEVPSLPRHPFVPAAVLVEHHAGPGSPLPSLAMDAASWRLLYQPGLLEAGLDPGVAAGSPGALVPGVEMPCAPARMPSVIARGQSQDLIHGRPAVGCLGDPPIVEGIQPPVVVPLDVAAERAVGYPQDPGRLLLRKPSLLPSVVRFLESFHPDLLQPFRRSHGHLHGNHENRTGYVLQDRTNHKLPTIENIERCPIQIQAIK